MLYKWYVLGLLLLVSMVNYVDRLSIYVLQIQIKDELHLSDTQLGALTGVAFSAVYILFVVPVARVADRGSRKIIIAAALVLWSILTALCGFSAGFISLMVLRMGVAVGEAGSLPASHSIISDYFERHRRATAFAIWSLSIPAGQMLSFVVGGVLGDALGWRDVFIVIGVFGFCLAPLVLFTLKEPHRGATDTGVTEHQAVPFWESFRILLGFKSMVHILLGGALASYVLYVVLNWSAPFYNRVHGASLQQLGLYLALVIGIGSGLGTILGGIAADQLGRKDARWRMWVPAIGALGFIPFALAQYLVGGLYLSLVLGIFPLILGYAFYAPTVACVQTLAPANLRAFAASLMLIALTIFGMSLGPLATGMISDFLIAKYGMETESLRYAIISSMVFSVWGAYHYHRAAQLLPDDIKRSAALASAVASPPQPSVVRNCEISDQAGGAVSASLKGGTLRSTDP